MIGSLATCSLAKKFISQRGSLKLEQVTCAASLAHHGYIRTIEDLKLERLDLSSIPSDHLASLVSCVTSSVEISNVSGFDLVCFMESIRCEWLYIGIGVNMGSEETKALVRAMESHLINERLDSIFEECPIQVHSHLGSFGPCWSQKYGYKFIKSHNQQNDVCSLTVSYREFISDHQS